MPAVTILRNVAAVICAMLTMIVKHFILHELKEQLRLMGMSLFVQVFNKCSTMLKV